MPIFSVCTKNDENDEPLGTRILSTFPNSHYDIGRGQWLVVFSGTSQELYKKLFPEPDFPLPLKGVTIFGVAGYYGIASRDMWEWIATKLLEGAKNT
jgi:hypothetical protein